MNDAVIVVRGLGKRYHIGRRQERYKTFRETLVKAVGVPYRFLKRRFQKGGDAPATIWALRDVGFDVKAGEVLGVIGRNGAGKSTLLKILSRITEPTEGYAEIHGRVGSLLEVGTGFHPELTGRENIYLNGAILGMGRGEIARKFDEIVAFSEVDQFIDTPVKHYSSGMYLRLAFSVAAHLEPEILIVDEVLAVGDSHFQAKCLGKMRSVAQSGRTVLFVSHNMEAVISLCTSCMVIDQGRIQFSGTPEAAVSLYFEHLAPARDASEPHVLYSAPAPTRGSAAWISRIEMREPNGSPKPMVQTWDDVLLRVHYVASKEIRNGSVIIDLRDFKNQRIAVFDSGLKVPLAKGEHYVDCLVPRWPLSAGQFVLGAGLALSNQQWVWRDTSVASLRVHGRDVFEIGRPPVTNRMVFAIAHQWRSEGSSAAAAYVSGSEPLLVD
ncbi:MAG: ABC transporter ATP-binding protein [Thermoanaerobaculia bacterium]